MIPPRPLPPPPISPKSSARGDATAIFPKRLNFVECERLGGRAVSREKRIHVSSRSVNTPTAAAPFDG